MKLKRIVEQQDAASQYYDLGKDFSAFTQTMDTATEDVKNRFEQAISSKLKGKKIRARASRGYKQFEKDYEINVVNVSLDDYYDNYVVVVKGNNGKEYFLKPGFKVQVLGAAEEPKPEDPSQQQPQPQSPPQAQPQPPQAPQASPQPPAPVKEESSPGSNGVEKYSKEEIEKDLTVWLPKLLMRSDADLRRYITREGIFKKDGSRTIISYGISIPVEDIPGLSSDQIKDELARVSESTASYTLDKFDSRNDKYILIIKKILYT